MPDACMGISAENVNITADPNDEGQVSAWMDFKALFGTGCTTDSVGYEYTQGSGLSMSDVKYGNNRIVVTATEKASWNGHLTKVKATFTGTEANGDTAEFICKFKLQSC